jgi:hypothetical protein
VSDAPSLKPPALAIEPRILAGVAAGLAAFTALQPRVLLATLPRVLLPWGDFPPYSPTRLAVTPAGARVDYGSNVAISVRVSGRRPASVALTVRGGGARRAVDLPAYEAEENVYARTLENVTEPLTYWARIPGGRSKRYRLELNAIPRLDAVHVAYRYPAYTRLRPAAHALTDGVVKGYAGTRVTLRLTSNRDLRDGQLTLEGQILPMRPTTDPKSVAAEFEIARPGAFEAFVRDTEGRASTARATGRVVVVPDEKPDVAIVSPGKDSFATPDASVPVNIEARDDLGLCRVHLFRAHNGSPDYRKTLYESAAGEHPFVNVIESLDLRDLGVRPGDVLDYYAAAADNRPDRPGAGVSPAFKLLIISQEQYDALVRARMTAADLREKYDALLERLDDLAEQQEQLREQTRRVKESLQGGTTPEATKLETKRLEAAQEKLARRAAELAKRFREEAARPGQYDVERDYKRALEAIAVRLDAAGDGMRLGDERMRYAAAADQADQADAALNRALENQDTALEALGRARKDDAQRVAQANREIEKLFELHRDVATFKRLLARQEALARQSAYLAERRSLDFEDRARLKELGEEQDAVRGELAALKEALGRHAADVEAVYPKVAADARGIAARLDQLRVEPLMGEAAGALNRLAAADGHRAAREAYEAMRSMVSVCDGTGAGAEGECEQRLRIAMNIGLGRTFGQLGRGLQPGSGGGRGGIGEGTEGVGGASPSPIGLYGGSDLTNEAMQKSATGIGRRPTHAPAAPLPPGQVASDSEELKMSEKSELEIAIPHGEHLVEEYRRAILHYFTIMAEQPQ